MTKPKKLICWVTRRPAKFETQHFERFCHTLSANGWEIRWIQGAPSFTEETAQDWLSAQIPPECEAIFFGDKDLDWFRPVTSALRNLPVIVRRHVPVLWVYEEMDLHRFQLVSEEGLSDFFPASIVPHELMLRLTLRCREAQDRIAVELRIQEEAAKNAKAETVLKQREEFLGVAAHDLRSPLGLIQSSGAMILKAHSGKNVLTPTDYELISRMKRQAEQALSLVNDLLDVMSFEQGLQPKYQVLDLDAVLQEFYADYKLQAEQKKVKFHYDNEVRDWKVLGDADRVRQLLQNLFSNALKYTDPGKNIHLAVTAFQGRRRVDPQYPMIVITVKDEGKGIPKRELQRIFDRFSQIKDHTKPDGRGLGLTVAKQISTLHEGNIWVESEEGKGSTFFVLFPHVISAQEEPAVPGFHILVAEPNVARRETYFAEMEKWGTTVHFAKDGADAIALAHFLQPDLIILTADLPKMAALEVHSVLKSDIQTSQIPVFIASEPVEKIENKLDTHKFERALLLPIAQNDLEVAAKSVGLTITPLPTPAKKAA